MFKKIKSRFANFISAATSNLFKSALKQKCLLLLIIATSICMPIHRASAGFWDIPGSVILKLAQSIIYLVAFFLLIFAAYFVKIGAYLVDVMLDQGIYAIIFKISDPNNPLMVGWAVIREFANTFFIFILLIIAFSTILRISKYSAKNLLPKFIIALFLINFSAVIALIVIDFGQVFMYEIVTWLGNGFGGNNGAMGNLTSIVDNQFLRTYSITGNIDDGTDWSLQNAIGISFALAFTVIMGCVYIMLAGFLLIRLTVLAILVVLSPIAFLGIIMPGLSSHAATWWRKLFEYSLFGPIFIFFVFLASQMAGSLTTYPVDASAAGLEGLSAFVGIIIPYCVAIAMLLAVIPITKQLGIAGTGALMGGAMGVGKIAMGTYAGAKLAGGLGKKAGGAPVSRIHSLGKGVSKDYNKLSSKTSGALKKLPIAGAIVLKHEAAQSQKKKEKVAEKEKLMETMTDKDKKIYVDSFRIDKNAKAEAQQAMFNLMAKDSGKGLTNGRLQKAGYEKDKLKADGSVMTDAHGNKVKEFDKERFMSDYGRASAHGMDTTNIETYRPDLIKDKGDKLDRVRKTVTDGNEKSIKLDVLMDEDIKKELKGKIGKKKYDALINSKSQEERDGLVELKEDKIIQRGQIYRDDPANPEGLDLSAGAGTPHRDEITKTQEEIAYLTGAENKKAKMKDVSGLDANGNLTYSGNVNVNMVKNVMGQMSKDQFLDLNSDFLKEQGHLISETVLKHMDKFGEVHQLQDIKFAIDEELRLVRAGGGTSGFTDTQLTTKKGKVEVMLA